MPHSIFIHEYVQPEMTIGEVLDLISTIEPEPDRQADLAKIAIQKLYRNLSESQHRNQSCVGKVDAIQKITH